MTSEQILHAITTARKQRGISEAELSRVTGIERRYLGKVLQGKHSPTLDKIIVLCAAVGVRIELINLPIEGETNKP